MKKTPLNQKLDELYAADWSASQITCYIAGWYAKEKQIEQEKLRAKEAEKIQPWPRTCSHCSYESTQHGALPPRPSYACPRCNHLLGI
jgi:hypothetical protein